MGGAIGIDVWTCVLPLGLPAGSVYVTVFWAVMGALVQIAPWLGARFRQLTHASLRARLILLIAGVTGFSVIFTIALDARSDAARRTRTLLDQQRAVAVAVAASLAAHESTSSAAEAIRQVGLARESMRGVSDMIYLVDGSGRVIAPQDRSPRREILQAVSTSSAAGPSEYVAPDAEGVVVVVPVDGHDWWVVAERPTPQMLAEGEAAADSLIALLMIPLAAVLGALAVGPLIAPLRVMSRAAAKVPDDAGSDPLPRNDIAEVAPLADAFTALRERLAIRTAEHERAEAGLHEAHRTMTALISASPVAVISIDQQGLIKEWNPAAERVLGWQRSEVLGRDISMLLADQQGHFPSSPLLAGSTFDGVEMRLRTRQKHLVTVSMWSAPLRNQHGNIDGSLVIAADITERKRLESERARHLREEAARAETQAVLDQFTFLANATGDLSISLDLDATLQRAASVAVPKLADWCTLHLVSDLGTIETMARAVADPSLESMVNELQEHYPPSPGGLSPGAAALSSGEPVVVSRVTREWLASTATDEHHLALLERLGPRSVMGLPLIAREHVIGAMTFVSVMPDRHYDAASLAVAAALARRCALAIDNARLHRQTRDALRARETFLSVASHELRAPLARLNAHAEVLQLAHAQHAVDDALLTRSLNGIQRATTRLTTMIQDLLDTARWRGEEPWIHPTRADVGKLVREFVAGYRERLAANQRLTLRVARGRHVAMVDVGRMEQVYENLLDNAFKYSPAGGSVEVAVCSERGGVLVQVQDAGMGLPSGATEVIFEPFGRASNALQRSISGIGLGLYICRAIVERHGGRIWASSPGEQQGTTMSVWLPGAHV